MKNKKDNSTLLQIKDLKIEGLSDERWHKIIKGVNLELKRGEVLGLIGESGAGKSTLGLAAMGYTQPGCRITGGQINFDGVDLTKRTDSEKRKYWGNRMTYVAQSAAASFNPAHRLINQTTESTIRAGLKKQNGHLMRHALFMMLLICPIQKLLVKDIHTKSRVGSFSV